MTRDVLIDYAAGRFTGPVLRGLGLPTPRELKRTLGPCRADELTGRSVVTGSVDGSFAMAEATRVLEALGAAVGPAERVDVAIFDATGCRDIDCLESLRAFFGPMMRRLSSCARLVVIGPTPAEVTDSHQRAAASALEGFVRSLAKEAGRNGSTANLLLVNRASIDRLDGPLRFFCSFRSAYVSGRSVLISAKVRKSSASGLHGRFAVVTGAARGLGAATVQRLAEEGAKVLCIDVPSARAPLEALAAQVGGLALEIDITAADASARLIDFVRKNGSVIDVLVHNAGITRDRTLAKMTEAEWASVMAVNVKAVIELDAAIDAATLLGEDAREICLSSISGIAGNVGQSNYAASKAALIGYASARASVLAGRGITVNCVAPGFIETEMTQKIPTLIREAGRRMNALSQGGHPRDVAELICCLAMPDASGITGQTIRVCGQALLGA